MPGEIGQYNRRCTEQFPVTVRIKVDTGFVFHNGNTRAGKGIDGNGICIIVDGFGFYVNVKY